MTSSAAPDSDLRPLRKRMGNVLADGADDDIDSDTDSDTDTDTDGGHSSSDASDEFVAPPEDDGDLEDHEYEYGGGGGTDDVEDLLDEADFIKELERAMEDEDADCEREREEERDEGPGHGAFSSSFPPPLPPKNPPKKTKPPRRPRNVRGRNGHERDGVTISRSGGGGGGGDGGGGGGGGGGGEKKTTKRRPPPRPPTYMATEHVAGTDEVTLSTVESALAAHGLSVFYAPLTVDDGFGERAGGGAGVATGADGNDKCNNNKNNDDYGAENRGLVVDTAPPPGNQAARDMAAKVPLIPRKKYHGAMFAKRNEKPGPRDPQSTLNEEKKRSEGKYKRRQGVKHSKGQHVHYIHNLSNQYMVMLQTFFSFALSFASFGTVDAIGASGASGASGGGGGAAVEDKETAKEAAIFQSLVTLCTAVKDAETVLETGPPSVSSGAIDVNDAEALRAARDCVMRDTVRGGGGGAGGDGGVVVGESILQQMHVITALDRLAGAAEKRRQENEEPKETLPMREARKAFVTEIALLLQDMACTGTWDRFCTMYGGPMGRHKDMYMMMMRYGMDERVRDTISKFFDGDAVEFARQLRDWRKHEHVQSFGRYLSTRYKADIRFHTCADIPDVRHLSSTELEEMAWHDAMPPTARPLHEMLDQQQQGDDAMTATTAATAVTTTTTNRTTTWRKRARGGMVKNGDDDDDDDDDDDNDRRKSPIVRRAVQNKKARLRIEADLGELKKRGLDMLDNCTRRSKRQPPPTTTTMSAKVSVEAVVVEEGEGEGGKKGDGGKEKDETQEVDDETISENEDEKKEEVRKTPTAENGGGGGGGGGAKRHPMQETQETQEAPAMIADAMAQFSRMAWKFVQAKCPGQNKNAVGIELL